MTESVSPRLREMRWWDIDPVLELEKELFPEDAWSRGMFWSELAHARGRRRPGGTWWPRWTVRRPGAACGSSVTPASPPPHEQADIQTIAVARDHWGTGLGSTLLTELLTAASEFECAEIMLECRVDNVRAQKLYERFGFAPIGFRRGYYQPGNVDALVMRLTTDPDSSSAAGSPSVQGTEIHD